MSNSGYGGKRPGAGRPKGKPAKGRIIGVSKAELARVEAGIEGLDKRPIERARLMKWFRQSCVPSRRRVRQMMKYIEDIEGRVIDALGGPEVVTPQKEIILKAAMRALQVALIVELYINQEGPIRKDMLERGIVDLQPALEKIVSFYNACRLNLVAIGLEARRADEILNLDNYLKATEKPPIKAPADLSGQVERRGNGQFAPRASKGEGLD